MPPHQAISRHSFSFLLFPAQDLNVRRDRLCEKKYFTEVEWNSAPEVNLTHFVNTDDEEWDYWEAREVSIPCEKGIVEVEPNNYTMFFELDGHGEGTACDGTILLFVGGSSRDSRRRNDWVDCSLQAVNTTTASHTTSRRMCLEEGPYRPGRVRPATEPPALAVHRPPLPLPPAPLPRPPQGGQPPPALRRPPVGPLPTAAPPTTPPSSACAC